MAVLTKTVGGTTPDYTTITLAEASIPANMVTDGNQRRFQCRDVTFTEADIDWGAGVTTDSTNYPALEAESGSAFNGIAGNGPIIDKSTGTATASGYVIRLSADYSQLINIEVSNSQTRATSGDYIGISVNSDFNLVARNIVHDIDSAPTTRRAKGIDVAEALSLTFYILNNVVHNIGGTNQGRGIVMGLWNSGHTGHIIGNSVYNAAPSANGFGITASWDNGSASTLNCYNNISIGQNNDYDQQGTTALTLNASNNGDGDFTALGTSAQSGLSASTEWVSITAGSEDLHLNSGATSVGNGSDRATTPTGVEIDIDGYDRDAGGDVWDIGADEQGKPAGSTTFTQSVAGSVTPSGALASKPEVAVAGGVTPSGALTRQPEVALAGSVTASGTVATTSVMTKAVAGSVTPTGGLVSRAGRKLAGSVAPVGALAATVMLAVAGSVTPIGTLATQPQHALAGSVTPSGSLTATAVKTITLAGSVTATGSLTPKALIGLAGAVTPTGTLTRLPAIGLTGSVTPGGVLTPIKSGTPAITLSGSVTPAGGLTLVAHCVLGGSVTPAGGLTAEPRLVLAGSVTPTGSVVPVRATTLAIGGSVTPSGTLGLRAIQVCGGSVTPAGVLSALVTVSFGGSVTPSGTLTAVNPLAGWLEYEVSMVPAVRYDVALVPALACDVVLVPALAYNVTMHSA